MIRGNDSSKILEGPISTERAVREMEAHNTIIFRVAKKATKRQIKWAIEKEFEVTVAGVRTQITPKGIKKAFIKLTPDMNAADVTSKLGLV
jgi:ribosomal protein uL23